MRGVRPTCVSDGARRRARAPTPTRSPRGTPRRRARRSNPDTPVLTSSSLPCGARARADPCVPLDFNRATRWSAWRWRRSARRAPKARSRLWLGRTRARRARRRFEPDAARVVCVCPSAARARARDARRRFAPADREIGGGSRDYEYDYGATTEDEFETENGPRRCAMSAKTSAAAFFALLGGVRAREFLFLRWWRARARARGGWRCAREAALERGGGGHRGDGKAAARRARARARGRRGGGVRARRAPREGPESRLP